MRSISEMRRILLYLRTARSKREWGPEIGGLGSTSMRLVVALMLGVSLLENTSDHLVQRWVLHAHIDDGVPVENDAQHLRHAVAIHFQVDDRPILAHDFTEPG